MVGVCACGSVSSEKHKPDDAGVQPSADADAQAEADAGAQLDAGSSRLVVSPMTISVSEGTTKTMNVLLGADPGHQLVVNIVSSNPAALPISPDSITFTAGSEGNWKLPIQVTASPPIDSNNVSETATITVSAPGIASDVDVAAVVQDTTTIAQFGWPAPPRFTDGWGISENFIVAYQITIDVDTTLDSFGVFNRLAVRDSLYRMALYRDANGRPGAIVAQMAAPVLLEVGPNIFDLTPDIAIDTIDTTAGKRFWLAVESSQGINGAASPTETTASCSMGVANVTDPFPVAFDPSRCTTGVASFNVWINTYHQ